ncbi:cobalamin-independent methionine synthase II family protein [Lactococcus piscium]|uniref:cobalamin-independent methionine synthase II family protein n=1 Tax=Pseudolactococcus carnosus TaxID=2749961 RepID=UPI000BDD9915|nr:cobalamin-independent methionine synthase II family protein [Lactococcus carnosus]SOB47597.1 5-methyltetrahydropteroyltriglutamate--homocysteine methyltransferase [Lactococcus piscium]MCJ1974043.1 cobalamin-independent methionine synthase II family protein [Lactococcus carnosus]MCJ1974789.1 cobalamin-independent methionine synthase II family protein [Lactococcus carnosus]MCJ1981123.1 cobalamin-independent methionine synthase II family protein [Lactococcus carnosus]MCJ1984861.1 cobalamin-ind
MSEKFQIVGSLLRPKGLLDYKNQIQVRDDITYPFYEDFEGYQATETQAIQEVIKKQIDHHISIVSDGEFSKSLWHLDFVWGLKGVRRFLATQGYLFRDTDAAQDYETRRDIGLTFTEKLSGKNHHFIEIYKEILANAGEHTTKSCIPSPSHIFGEWSFTQEAKATQEKDPDAYYHDASDFKADLAAAYKEFLSEYVAVGGKIIQFDDCLWERFSADNPHSTLNDEASDQEKNEALAQTFIDLNNDVIDYGHSLGLAVWTHNCRGNYDSRYLSGGSYETIANLFLKQQHYDRFFLEWDDERAGNLSALEVFRDRPETEVVLGFLSSKTATLDDEARVIALLEQASQIIPKERLYLSHQCGFASCDSGNELSESQQWAKIDQGQALALAFFGE